MKTLRAIAREVFQELLAVDVRDLDSMTLEVRMRLIMADMRRSVPGVIMPEPTDHEIQMAISRNCMGDPPWDYYPAYSSPPRYISIKRVKELVERTREGTITPDESTALHEMYDDLQRVLNHNQARINSANTHCFCVSDLRTAIRRSVSADQLALL